MTELKIELVDAIEALVRDDLHKSRLRTEVTRTDNLNVQVKVWPDETSGRGNLTGVPRYFNIKVSEAT